MRNGAEEERRRFEHLDSEMQTCIRSHNPVENLWKKGPLRGPLSP